MELYCRMFLLVVASIFLQSINRKQQRTSISGRMITMMMVCSYFLLASLLLKQANAFTLQTSPPVKREVLQTSSSSSLKMISFGGISGGTDGPELPRDVKEAVTKCRAAVQEALQKRLSRMDIEMPVGAKFGVEKGNKKKKKMDNDSIDGAPTKAELETSDRELARIFVEMFQPLGGEHISVIFNEANMAELAKKKWKGDPSSSSRVMSLGRRKKKAGGAKNKKPKGFAAKLAAEVGDGDSESGGGPFQLPDGTELAIFVAPGPKELVMVEKVCKDVGMDTLVILLNARLSKVETFGTEEARNLFLEEFEPVFSLRAAPQEDAPGCLLHRAYPKDWMLARKPKVGQPKVILTQKERPSSEECREAYESIEIGDVEKGVEQVLDGVAGWFR